MNEQQVTEIEQRALKSGHGPRIGSASGDEPYRFGVYGAYDDADERAGMLRRPIAGFVDHDDMLSFIYARSDILVLIAEIRRLREDLHDAEMDADSMWEHRDCCR